MKTPIILKLHFVLLRNSEVILRDNQNPNNVKKQHCNLDKNVKIV